MQRRKSHFPWGLPWSHLIIKSWFNSPRREGNSTNFFFFHLLISFSSRIKEAKTRPHISVGYRYRYSSAAPHDVFFTWLAGIQQRDLILNDNQLSLNLFSVYTVITCKSFCSVQRVTGLYSQWNRKPKLYNHSVNQWSIKSHSVCKAVCKAFYWKASAIQRLSGSVFFILNAWVKRVSQPVE